jgi:hypothetical protein
MLQSMKFHPLWCGTNGPREIFQAITVFLVVLECHSNGRDASNGNISSSWRSSNIRFSNIPVKFQFCKPSFCEVLSGTSCNFSNFSFFLLSFLAFFPIIYVSGFLFPFMFLSLLGMVTSHCGGFFKGFEGNTYSLSRVGALFSCMEKCFKSSCVISTSTAWSLALISFELSSCSHIKCAILLAMKSLSSFFFFSGASSSCFLHIRSFSTQVFPRKITNGVLFSTNVTTSNSSSIENP